MKAWFLTFYGEQRRFLGAAVVETVDEGDFFEAIIVAQLKDCNPGGEVSGYEIPAVLVPKFSTKLPRERWGVLLDRHELERRDLIQRSH
jgi:hypothetical protein